MSADVLLAALAQASVDGAVLVGLVWLACRLLPSMPPRVRTALWWLATAKLLLALAPTATPLAFPVPVPDSVLRTLPWALADRPSPSTVIELPLVQAAAATAATEPMAVESEASETSPLQRLASVAGLALVVLWLGGVGLQAWRATRGVLRLRGIVRRASRPSPELASTAAALAERLGLARAPRVRVSSEIDVPQVTGPWQPTVLVPAAAVERFTADELAMTLCHEIAHVRRQDLRLGLVPAVVERLFFFHPLARLAAREYALAREAACDQAVLEALDAAPRDYGRLLVQLGVRRQGLGLAAAGSSPTVHALRRRLDMLQHAAAHRPHRLWLVPVAILVVALPFTLQAQVPPEPPTPPAALAPPAPAIPATPAEAPLPPTPPSPAATPAPPVTASAVLPPTPPSPAVAQSEKKGTPPPPPPPPPPPGGHVAAPPPPPPPPPPAIERLGNSDAWVLLSDGHRMMSGSMADVKAAEAQRRGNEPLLYFRRGDQAYVVRDPAVLEAVRSQINAQMKLAEEQAGLASHQAHLAGQQGALGGQQAAIGARQAARAAEEAARVMAMSEEQRRAHVQRTRETEAALAAEQRKLAEQQQELAVRQAELGRQQAKLGESHRRTAQVVHRALADLIDRAVASGTATPIK